jgi:flagellar biosynthetic protein FlhB
MSETSTPEERTEMPTDRRMGQLRKEGQLPLSTEIVQTVTLTTGFLALGYFAPVLFEVCRTVFVRAFDLIGRSEPLTVRMLQDGFFSLALLIAPPLVFLTLIVASVATLAVMLQTDWNVKEKKLHFKMTHIDPLAGIRRIFSIGGFVNVAKAILKLCIFLPIAYFSLKKFAPQMVTLMHMQIDQIFVFASAAMSSIFWKIFMVLCAISAFDYLYTNWSWLRQNKMTKDEVKDDRKAQEGDEATKKAIQRKGLARIAQRIKQTVPKADVIITNPTHFAVALKYDRETMSAPTVIAKGQDYLALRIREIARESGVPIVERKILARSLYASCEVGSVIPRDLFKAVAEVLAYIYRLKNPWKAQQQAQGKSQSQGSVR